MNSKNIVLLSVLAFILILGGCACNGYNSLVGKDENVKAKWSNVESDYQRRSDLIPNLVNTVKGAATCSNNWKEPKTESKCPEMIIMPLSRNTILQPVVSPPFFMQVT